MKDAKIKKGIMIENLVKEEAKQDKIIKIIKFIMETKKERKMKII